MLAAQSLMRIFQQNRVTQLAKIFDWIHLPLILCDVKSAAEIFNLLFHHKWLVQHSAAVSISLREAAQASSACLAVNRACIIVTIPFMLIFQFWPDPKETHV